MDAGYAAKQMNVARTSIQRLCVGIIKMLKNQWIGSFNKEELELKIKNTVVTCGCFETQYTGRFVYKGDEFIGNVKEAAKHFNISKSYIYGVCNKSRKSNILLFIPN